MDLTKMLAELKAERDGVEQAIIVLQRMLPVAANGVVVLRLRWGRSKSEAGRRGVRTNRRNRDELKIDVNCNQSLQLISTALCGFVRVELELGW
jgi:hypothetical protein